MWIMEGRCSQEPDVRRVTVVSKLITKGKEIGKQKKQGNSTTKKIVLEGQGTREKIQKKWIWRIFGVFLHPIFC